MTEKLYELLNLINQLAKSFTNKNVSAVWDIFQGKLKCAHEQSMP